MVVNPQLKIPPKRIGYWSRTNCVTVSRVRLTTLLPQLYRARQMETCHQLARIRQTFEQSSTWCYASRTTAATRGHDCSLSVAIPTTLLPRKQMQSLRHAPHRLGPPDRPGRRTSNAVFLLRGNAFPAVVSLLRVLAGDIE